MSVTTDRKQLEAIAKELAKGIKSEKILPSSFDTFPASPTPKEGRASSDKTERRFFAYGSQ